MQNSDKLIFEHRVLAIKANVIRTILTVPSGRAGKEVMPDIEGDESVGKELGQTKL